MIAVIVSTKTERGTYRFRTAIFSSKVAAREFVEGIQAVNKIIDFGYKFSLWRAAFGSYESACVCVPRDHFTFGDLPVQVMMEMELAK